MVFVLLSNDNKTSEVLKTINALFRYLGDKTKIMLPPIHSLIEKVCFLDSLRF
jgi:hypothetical protein